MKLLPKLVGIDKNDDGVEKIYETLGIVISELDDNELADAFTKSRDKMFFEWNGVNRKVTDD